MFRKAVLMWFIVANMLMFCSPVVAQDDPPSEDPYTFEPYEQELILVTETQYTWQGDGCTIVISHVIENQSLVGDNFDMSIHIGNLPPNSQLVIYKDNQLEYIGNSLSNLYPNDTIDILFYKYETYLGDLTGSIVVFNLIYTSPRGTWEAFYLQYEVTGGLTTMDQDLYEHGRIQDDELEDLYDYAGVYDEPEVGFGTVQKYLLAAIVFAFLAGFLGYMFGRKMVNKALMVWGTVAEYDFSWTLGFALIMTAGGIAWYTTRSTLAKLGEYQRTPSGVAMPAVTSGELTSAVLNILIITACFLFFWGWYKIGVRFTEGEKPVNFHVTNADPDPSEGADIVVNIEPLIVRDGFAIPVRRKPTIGPDGRMRLMPVTSFDYWKRLFRGYEMTSPVFVMLDSHRLGNAPALKVQGSRGYYLDALEVETMGGMFKDTEDQIVSSAVHEAESKGEPSKASSLALPKPSKTLNPRAMLRPSTWKWVQRRREKALRNRFVLVAVPSYGMAGTEATIHNIVVNSRAAKKVELTEQLLGLYTVKDHFDVLHSVSQFLSGYFKGLFHRLGRVGLEEEEEAQEVRDYYRERSTEVDNQVLEEGTLGG